MSVFLRTNCYGWSHAGITEGLRIWEVLLACLVDEVCLPTESRNTLVAGLFVGTIVL
jgi:hypothetical protein